MRRTSVLPMAAFAGGKTLAQAEFTSAEQDETGAPARPRPGGAHDHAMDEIRYFVMSLEEGGGVAATSVERKRF